MRRAFLDMVKRSRFAIIGAVFVLGVAGAGLVGIVQPSLVAAASCPQDDFPNTNIIYCGLSGSDGTQLASSLQTYFNNNNDGHGHTDLQAVYNATGLTSGMFSTGTWHLGTSSDNDTITVDGNVVGTNVNISSRCFSGMSNCQPSDKYTHLKDKNGNTVSNVYTRDASWFFDKDSKGNPIHSQPTLVHMNTNGQADFAIWTNCGNVLTFKPKEMPKSLTCDSLTAQATDDKNLSYKFTAKASAQNMAISSYTFDFGDNNQQTVNTSKTTATTTHTYTQTDSEQTVKATVAVNGSVTSGNCQTEITIPAKQQQQSLACVSLTATPLDTAKTNYRFTATASATNTTITSYTFNFGDSTSQQTVNTSATTANVDHQFDANKAATYTITAKVTGPLGSFGSQGCSTTVTITPPQVLGTTTLVNTGPGSIVGLFALTTVAGGLLHHFVLRKKYQA